MAYFKDVFLGTVKDFLKLSHASHAILDILLIE